MEMSSIVPAQELTVFYDTELQKMGYERVPKDSVFTFQWMNFNNKSDEWKKRRQHQQDIQQLGLIIKERLNFGYTSLTGCRFGGKGGLSRHLGHKAFYNEGAAGSCPSESHDTG